MFRLRKSTKYIIIAVLILAAGYLAVKMSGINGILDQKIQVIKMDDDKAARVFDSLENEKKIKMIYNSTDLAGFTGSIQDFYVKYDISPLYSNITAGYYVSIFSYPGSLSENVMTDLRQLENLNHEFLASADPNSFKINIDEHIANKKRVKRTLEKKIDNAILLSDERITQYSSNLTRIQMEIDSLNNQKNIIQGLADNNLVYLVTQQLAVSGDKAVRTKRIGMVRNFVIYFIVFLLLSILVLTILNFFFFMLLKFMGMLGIKTSRSSSGGYNYGGQSYRSKYYYRRPKKVKRVYKDSEGNIVKQKVSKE